MKGIFVVPVGEVNSEVLNAVAAAIEKAFQCPVALGNGIPISQDSYNLRRKQYYSSMILAEMQDIKPRDFDRMVGVIDADLYAPELNFVFGEADMSSGITIISLTRLRQEFYGLAPDGKIFEERAVKEAIHELGHTYGLGHCHDPRCIMYFSNSLKDTDTKGPGFCNVCRKKLCI